MRILLIEDDAMLSGALSAVLAEHGHAVDGVRDGATALDHWRSADYELVLLDLGLPGNDGLRVLAEARQQGLSAPVLVITAREAVQDRIAGLDAGADDYLLKPFDLAELPARVRALGRRRTGSRLVTMAHNGLELDAAQRSAVFNGLPVNLTRREFALLSALMERPGQLWTREQLMERLYRWDEEIASNSLEVHIHSLRRKLTADYIRTMRGVGYALATP